jgi:hypothetical protein
MADIVKMLRECSSDEAYLSRQAADEITRLRAEIERLTAERDRQYDQNTEQITRIAALEVENEELRAALCPLAGVFLYPDDLGFEASSDIKEDLDWDDDANDMNTENVFVLRRDIRRARAALSASQPAQEAPAP